ncbi:hypothetical protein VNO77_07754 [Canavalia gladiata]|uniref:SAM-dependent MTase RsmB/NOP-type domain-containing protein n=1 Tax=Canavalia gladiata TaxID=3824 RepID=A0AAN9M8V4_CANGL
MLARPSSFILSSGLSSILALSSYVKGLLSLSCLNLLNMKLAKVSLRPGAGNMVSGILRKLVELKENEKLPLPKVEGDDCAQARALTTLYSYPVRIHLMKLVKPGGVLVYSTCSIDPKENDERVAAFLVRHPDFRIDPVDMFVPPDFVTHSGFFFSNPVKHSPYGSFAARSLRFKKHELLGVFPTHAVSFGGVLAIDFVRLF